MKLYALVTIRSKDAWKYISTYAIFTTVEKAMECVKGDAGYLSDDGWFDYCVIEALTEGEHLHTDSEMYWSKWNNEEGRWWACQCPEEYSHTIGFWM